MNDREAWDKNKERSEPSSILCAIAVFRRTGKERCTFMRNNITVQWQFDWKLRYVRFEGLFYSFIYVSLYLYAPQRRTPSEADPPVIF